MKKNSVLIVSKKDDSFVRFKYKDIDQFTEKMADLMKKKYNTDRNCDVFLKKKMFYRFYEDIEERSQLFVPKDQEEEYKSGIFTLKIPNGINPIRFIAPLGIKTTVWKV